ncbi:MAG: DUF1549 domain-containing protein [Verrucomicrobia bacterium]|nr:DUF1549 domain-containing protein [Verrucomicrobiota bacterium]
MTVVGAEVFQLPPPAVKPVDFVRDIQPLLNAHCVSCHGPEKTKNSFRVDVREIFFKGGDVHGVAVVPGKSAESRLIHFVAGADAEIVMPAKGERLTATEVGLLRAWIDQGAKWPDSATVKFENKADWWSFKPLVRPAVPEVSEGRAPRVPDQSSLAKVGDSRSSSLRSVIRNPIDAFIAAKLAEKGMAQSPEADARTLIRRLYFDLLGLPPTPEEVEAFVADKDAKAYERLVDRLLASPRYGERWARHWLDVVHYGDTHGYDKDKPRPNAWPYRNYVIRAFNEDKPYARFVQEQLAGDVLFPGTRDGIEALGFVAAGPWDYIGHAEVPETKTDGKIARHLDRDDMVQSTMQTFNSLTVGCAQCHNHKFDPISQEDYYSLQAVFAALDRTDVSYYTDEAAMRRSRELEKQRTEITNAITALEAPLKKAAGEKLAALDRRIRGASEKAAQKQGNTSPDFGYHSAVSPTPNVTKWVQVDLGARATIDHVALRPCYDDFNGIGAGFGFPVRFKVEASDDPEFKSGVTLLWKQHDQTFMNDFRNPGLKPFTTGGAKDDGIQGRYVRVTAVKLAPRKNDFIFALAELEVFDQRTNNLALGRPVTALDSIEAPPRWRKVNLTDGIAPEAQSAEDRHQLVQEREALLLSFTDETTRAKLSDLKRRSHQLKAEAAKLPVPSKVYAGAVHTGTGSFRGTGADGGKPRPIFVLQRGSVLKPGKEVGPGALEAIAALPARFELKPAHPEGEGRAALAHWLTSPQHPLTWRSMVNRVWYHHFGKGLVETLNDFGRNGARPTHPELLDWLASEFRDGGGSLKKLHKLIVTSATYRQTSVAADVRRLTSNPKPETRNSKPSQSLLTSAATIDGDNRLLWRMNRRKLDAEAIRDSVLFVSGKLDLKMGGPAFQDFVVTHPEHSPHYEYQLHDPEDPKSHRRSIYRFIVRSQLQPFMTTLDCADPSMLVDRRNESLSPLQALALLNNGLMVVMPKHFAAKLDARGGELGTKVERAFYEATGRNPAADEKQSLTAYAQQHGLANACRVILNLNEFAFVD